MENNRVVAKPVVTDSVNQLVDLLQDEGTFISPSTKPKT